MQVAVWQQGSTLWRVQGWRWLWGTLLALLMVLWWWQAPPDGLPQCPPQARHCQVLNQAWLAPESALVAAPGSGLGYVPGSAPNSATAAEASAYTALNPSHAPHPLPWAAAQPQTGQQPLRLRLPFWWPEAAQPADAPLGLCLLRAPLVARVNLNGQPVDLPPVQAGSFLRPLHISLAPGAVPAGAHWLELAVLAPEGLTPGLGPVLLGDDRDMATHCQAQTEDIRARMGAVVGVMALLAVAGVLLWWQLRERQALWFALMAAVWVLHLLHVQGRGPTASLAQWGQLYFASRAAFVPPMLMFAFAFAGQPMQRWRLPLLATCAGAALLLLVLPPAGWALWLRGVAWLTLPLALAALGWLVANLRRAYSVSALLMTVAFALVIVSQGLDVARWGLDAGYAGRLWSYVTVPLVCAAFALQVVERLVGHARAEARDAARLRREVDAQRVRIAADYERLQRQREQLAVQEERRRIVRDMHDGLGAQLLSASAVLKSRPHMNADAVAALFDDALQELRSVLDVLTVDPACSDDDDPVAALLGTLRWRMGPALQARGVTLQWDCGALPAGFLPQDAARMHLLRLLQEAFSNVLKHAGATQVTLRAWASDDSAVHIEVSDNGRGFEPGGTHGIGLDSMRARATTIGAHFWLHSQPGQGTQMRLRWAGAAAAPTPTNG